MYYIRLALLCLSFVSHKPLVMPLLGSAASAHTEKSESLELSDLCASAEV